MNVLVATPIAEHKLYSLDDWVAATAGHPRAMSIDREDEYISPLIDRHAVTSPSLTTAETMTPFTAPIHTKEVQRGVPRGSCEYAKANASLCPLAPDDNIPL